MLFCPVCDGQYNTFDDFFRHIKIKHNFITKFSCKQSQCNRTFQNIYTLKKHFKLKHANDAQNTKQNDKLNFGFEGNKLQNSDIEISVDDSTANSFSEKEIYEDFKTCLIEETTLFISKLYSNYSLPRNIVQNVIQDTSHLLKQTVAVIKSNIDSLDCKSSVVSNHKEIIAMLDLFENLFKDLNTEYLRLKYFKSASTFMAPLSVIVGQTKSDKKTRSRLTLDSIDRTCQYIPIQETLKSFLQLPQVFERISSYMSFLRQSKAISNLIQCELWRSSITCFKNKIVFPLFLYADDFEIGNPLGSHAGVHKICAMYFTLGCLPPEWSSHLENIFLLQLCYSSDVKSFGNKNTFQNIIHDLIKLEKEGITISTESGFHTVYFSVALLLGDNLSMNSMLGLTESFNSNYYCRFCRCNKDEASSNIFEKSSFLRTPENYEIDLSTYSHGIKESCIWHMLPNFHLTDNVSCDIMHDIWEGVCRYDFGNMLYHFICEENFFSLETLNSRIQFFNFLDKNKPPSIPKSQLLKKHIIFSASEMSAFARNFSLLIGDCIPVHNEIWEMYLALIEIIDIVTSTVISEEDTEFLKILISEHHSLYLEFFGKLKPKHHFLTHYPRLIRKIGPLSNTSCMRFEAKHKQFKAAASVVKSRKNILYTLAVKNQLTVCHRLLAKNGFKETLEFGSEDLQFIGSLEYQAWLTFLDSNMSNDDYFATLWIRINGIKYTADCVLAIDCIDFQPIFGVIHSIVLNENTKRVYFVLNKLKTLCFNEHFHAYEVEVTDELLSKEWNELHNISPTLIYINNRKLLVMLRNA